MSDFSGTTHVLAILDRSGSMSRLRAATISSFNEWLADLRKAAGKTFVTIAMFDTNVQVPVVAAPAESVADLDESRYVPAGNTALYDGVVAAVRPVEAAVTAADRALVMILTDGEENSSRETTREQMTEMIARLEATGRWTFTYLSAAPSAFADSAAMGIPKGNTRGFAPTAAGMSLGMSAVRSASFALLSSDKPATRGFYVDQDLADQEPSAPVPAAKTFTAPTDWKR